MLLDDKERRPLFMSQSVDQPGVSDAVKSKATRCLRCRSLAVRLRMRPGRTIPFRDMQVLVVPDDVGLLTCGRCNAEYLDAGSAPRIDAILTEVYRHALRARVRRAIDLITEHISQRRLELLVGLSQGYLSRLRAGQGNPSPELVSHLALIAQDPPARLRELERFWADPDGFSSEILARG